MERGAPSDSDASAHIELPNKVRLLERVVREANIQTTPVTTRSLPMTIDLTGEVAFNPDRAAMVSARAPGRVAEVRFLEGDRVKRGAILAVIESPDLARARAAHIASTSRARTTRQNADRQAALARKGLASGQEVASAETDARAAESEAAAARQILSVFGSGALEQSDAGARLTIYSPIDGYVLQRNAIQGQTVSADALLSTIADFDDAYFLARLFEKDLAYATVGATADVRLNAYPQVVFTGKLQSVGRQIETTTRTVVARIAIRNQDDLLKAGLFGTARISAGDANDQQKSLVIPLSAVTHVGGKDVVFVHEGNGDFFLHAVTLGRSAEGNIQVLSGLGPNEMVVSEGVFVLKSAALKSTFGEDD
jgi:cobalt-zinc-cadmium efflux system membrane fusion protein